MNEQDYISTFAASLKQRRKSMHMSTYQFSELLGIARQSLMKYENGEFMPQLYTALRMANNLGISVDELVFGEKVSECRN